MSERVEHDTLVCPCGTAELLTDRTHYCPDDLWDESTGGYFDGYEPIVAFLVAYIARVRADERQRAAERVRALHSVGARGGVLYKHVAIAAVLDQSPATPEGEPR